MTRVVESKQQGVVLVVSLILLMLMTLIAVSAMRSTTLEERMGGNARNKETAFQAGEAVLRVGESVLDDMTAEPVPSSDGSTTVWVLDAPDPDITNSIAWWKESARDGDWWGDNAEAYNGTLDGVASVPMYLLEATDFVKDSLNMGTQQDQSGKAYYRVTARATGGNDLARVLLQSTYARRY